MAMERPRDPDLAARLFGSSPERALTLMRAAWPAAVGPELARKVAEPPDLGVPAAVGQEGKDPRNGDRVVEAELFHVGERIVIINSKDSLASNIGEAIGWFLKRS